MREHEEVFYQHGFKDDKCFLLDQRAQKVPALLWIREPESATDDEGSCWEGVGGAICYKAIKDDDDDDDNNGDNDDEDGGGYGDDDDDDDEDDESAFVCARASP